MKGDPLRGVHAFYSASAREWWAPLRPDRQVSRRNALVGVLDKPSEFAGRAVHEWTAQVFREVDGPVALGAVPAHDPHRAHQGPRQRKKYDDVELRAVRRRGDRRDRGAVRAPKAPGGPRPAWWEDVAVGDAVGPMVKGPLTVTDMVCWHAGMGMGLYGVKPLRLGYQNRTRIPRFYHRDELNVPDVMQRVHWDPEFARRSRQPHHVRLRPHARDVAHPPLHRLDG